MLINGQPCAIPGPIIADLEIAYSADHHRSHLVGGYCEETATGPLQAGSVDLTVEVGPVPTGIHGNCATGFFNITGYLEALEVL